MNIAPQKFILAFPIQKPVIGRTRSILFLCIAIVYGLVLSQIPDSHFKDFSHYLRYAESSWLFLTRYADAGLFSTFANEPVWLLINVGLGIFLESDTVVRTIIFFGASSIAWLILRYYPEHLVWLILFLFLPQIVKNYLIHLRQGTAIAVFLWGWFAVSLRSRWLLLGLTPLIHTSFFLILILLGFARVLRIIRFAPNLNVISYIFVGIVLALTMGFLADLLGARQAERYLFGRGDISGLGFLFWIIILGIMLSAGKTWMREHVFESGIIIFYLSTYWLIEVTARIFESGLIIVLLAGLTLRSWRRKIFLGMIFGGGGLVWFLEGTSLFGFGSS
jgi:hypothetical protein